MIFAVARTHFAKLKRDRAAFVLAFVVPVVFFSVFASIFRGSSSRATTRQISVVVVDEDRSANSARFVDALFDKIDRLQRSPRHPKWKDTVISASVVGLEPGGT